MKNKVDVNEQEFCTFVFILSIDFFGIHCFSLVMENSANKRKVMMHIIALQKLTMNVPCIVVSA